ncbi:MAG TPA: hypothetical protein VK858_16825 [Longimicrobiales bacterium]|nr:hypothetical protein [Longimicrobiales bacterium]
MLHPLVGHAEARRALTRAHAAGTLPATLRVMGPRGIGKQRFALWLAQLVLCEAPGPEGPCGTCRHCRRVLKLEHPDLHWYMPLARPKGVSREKLQEALEAARLDRLAELREEPLRTSWDGEPTAIYLAAARSLRKRSQSPAAEGREQVFLIGDAEALVPQASSPEAANALLKLLEEPPPASRFILTSSEPGRLLDTIRSRTIPLHLAPTDPEEALAFLVERGYPREETRAALALSGGSIGMALGYLPDEAGDMGPLEELRRKAFDILRAGLSPHSGDACAVALAYGPSGARALIPLLDALEVWLRDLAAVAAGAPGKVVNRDSASWLGRRIQDLGLHPAAIADALPEVETARGEARGNVNPQLVVAGLASRLRTALLSPLVTT